MTTLREIAVAAAPHRLAIFGAFHPGADDDAPDGTGTLVLLGPAEPGFWAHVTTEPEWRDSAPDPLDRWSARVIRALAQDFGGSAVFPFDGPPYRPFYRWALASGRVWASPVTLLVHESAGLMVSFRGALALPGRLDLPPPPAASPCDGCARPCLTACPAGALTAAGYDIGACHEFLSTEPGRACIDLGCAVRRACPVSQTYARVAEQSAYHMRLFYK